MQRCSQIITHRMALEISPLTDHLQTGFIPGRSIADNGWITQTLKAHVRKTEH